MRGGKIRSFDVISEWNEANWGFWSYPKREWFLFFFWSPLTGEDVVEAVQLWLLLLWICTDPGDHHLQLQCLMTDMPQTRRSWTNTGGEDLLYQGDLMTCFCRASMWILTESSSVWRGKWSRPINALPHPRVWTTCACVISLSPYRSDKDAAAGDRCSCNLKDPLNCKKTCHYATKIRAKRHKKWATASDPSLLLLDLRGYCSVMCCWSYRDD